MLGKRPILIVGASARAAAFSALRAGFEPNCADLFADADLSRLCPVVQVSFKSYPDGFLRVLRSKPNCTWIYVGALENHPALVRRMARLGPLLGNDADVLLRVRRPWHVATWLADSGLPFAAVQRSHSKLPGDGRWLVKPLASAGGRGIDFWSNDRSIPRRGRVYFQEYVSGLSCAAVYVGDAHSAQLLGVTRQLVGESWLNAAAFSYCGSIGPLPLSAASRDAFTSLGSALVKGFGLRGLFGVDCILRDGVPFPVEINPRYTASVEVLEHGLGISLMEQHIAAFDTGGIKVSAPSPASASPRQFVGKAILIARQNFIVPSYRPWIESLDHPIGTLRPFADIPRAGSAIRKGHPIVSFFVRANSEEECISEIQQRARNLDQALFER